ncbi:2-oxo-hepta-3-ene-1,7-dioate hydratase [Sutterella faecalis]|uniref:2-oxo-hepta-3-ene-1,7-dioate hydratase n=2 Tax=Sutterella TaxID=40544 RepID=A0AAI9WNU3_9BURK|nr:MULTISPECIES: 2-oxo-hepta-3-ene-1,7-dioate hydratase [Sutterella]KAB7652880.1 2-oxo-hepta-3-ene-1,7-dioate hydratase [Sutterella seckii]QDA54384.1 2-oxo-hepta-3-ene-1,7-dioate hydratase [Sutterella faecalis]
MNLSTLPKALFEAYKNNAPLEMKACEGILNDFETAYEVQRAVAEQKGEPTGGYKISLTSKTTQDMFGTTEPLFGEQIPSRILAAPAVLQMAEMNEPLIEVELSMIPKVDLEPGMSDEELLRNVTVAGGIEVPDARFKAWFPALNKYLVVADCAVGGYIIHGTPVDGTKLKLEDLLKIHVDLLKDGKVIKSGDSTEVLDQPIHALKWLVEALAKRGRKLAAGQVVSTGTFFVPPKLEKGEYIARYTGAITEDVKLSVR